MVVWLAPEHRVPTVLSTGEARFWICFGDCANEQHWGWITCDPYAAEPWKSYPWIKKLTDDLSTLNSTETPSYDAFLTTLKASSTEAIQSLQEANSQETTDAAEAMPAAGKEPEACRDIERPNQMSSPRATLDEKQMSLGYDSMNRDNATHFSRAVSIVRASSDKKQRSRGCGDAEALSGRDPQAKRALSGNSPPMKTSMISEMKRINALNLEPSLPKLEEKTRNGWLTFRQQTRNANKATGGGRKMEFQQSLEVISRRQAGKEQQQQSRQQQQQQDAQASGSNSDHATKDTAGSSNELYKWQ
jgi:hypothetical protein